MLRHCYKQITERLIRAPPPRDTDTDIWACQSVVGSGQSKVNPRLIVSYNGHEPIEKEEGRRQGSVGPRGYMA